MRILLFLFITLRIMLKCVLQNEIDYIETWRGMEKCFELGLTRSIGVSNFNSRQLTRLLDSAIIKPVMNQIEVHINLNQKKLRDFCASNSIAVTAYSPFGAPGRCTGFQPPGPDIKLQAPIVTNIAKKYNKTNAQIALRYLVSDFKFNFNVIVVDQVTFYSVQQHTFCSGWLNNVIYSISNYRSTLEPFRYLNLAHRNGYEKTLMYLISS